VRTAAWCVALCFATGAGVSQTAVSSTSAQGIATAVQIDRIYFDFELAALQPPHWGFEINSDGVGRYFEHGLPVGANLSGEAGQAIQVSAPTMEVLLAGRIALDGNKDCNSRNKKVAQTGKKTLSYKHDNVWSTCQFNYSDDVGVMRAVLAFQAMAATMEFGERLKHEHRFDKLGLDAELESLIDEASGGRAMEIQNIASTLQSLVADDTLMDRVRRKAQRLLDQSSGTASIERPR